MATIVREASAGVGPAVSEYAIVNGNLRHYHASLRVIPERAGSRIVWTVDLLPDDAAALISRIEATPSTSS